MDADRGGGDGGSVEAGLVRARVVEASAFEFFDVNRATQDMRARFVVSDWVRAVGAKQAIDIQAWVAGCVGR